MAHRSFIAVFIFLLWQAVVPVESPAQSEFNQLPDSLFADSQYPANPEVPFLYSLKKLDISFEETDQSIVAVLRYHVRVKIFDSSVQEASLVGIPYYFEDNIEQVQDIRGVTWQSPQQKIELSAEQVRTINVNSRYNVKEFTMPAVTDGSVIEYVYTIRRRYIEELPDFYLAHQVPTQRAEVSITYPQYLRYNGLVEDYQGLVRNFNSQRVPEGDAPKIYTFPQPDPVVTETWLASNIPAIRQESYITSLDDYRPKIKFQLSEFGIPRQTLENSWEFVVAELRRKQQINARINSYSQAQQRGASIAKEFDSKQAAQDSVFTFLNRVVNYSGSNAPFDSIGEVPVLNGEPSNQAAINQVLAAMLRGAGIEAHPVLVSTRSSGQINRDFPSFFQFNGQLVYSRIDGKSYFMDASFPYSHPNLISVEMYNEPGLLLGESGFQWLDIEPEHSRFGIDVDMQAELDRQGNLGGFMRIANIGYPAQQIRQRLAQGAPLEQVVRDVVFDGYGEVEVSSAQQLSSANADSIILSADFRIPKYALSFADGLDFRPMIVGNLSENPFQNQDRNLPITLDAPERLDLSYTINLPDGMELAQSPADNEVRLPGATFTEIYSNETNTLQYNFQIDIARKEFSTEQCNQLYQLYNRWVELSNSRWRIVR